MVVSARPFRPTARLAAAATTVSRISATVPKTPMANVIIPTIVVGGAVYGVLSYIYTQLKKESDTMNRIYKKQNTPELEEARKKALLLDTELDPRRSLYNFLSWK